MQRNDNNDGRKSGNPADFRLAFLGLLLIVFGAIALVAAHRNGIFLEDANGLSAIFGGLAIVTVFSKLDTLLQNASWISTGVFYAAAGFVLHSSNELPYGLFALLFCLLFQMSAVGRAWIGLRALPHKGAVWMRCSGIVATAGTLLIGTAFLRHMPATAPLVVALDTIFFGVSIAQLGSLRR